MLVLTRKVGQTICIGNDIEVTVTKDQDGRIGLGIDAPRSYQVDRKEVKLKEGFVPRKVKRQIIRLKK